jgi:hypothetical protein
MESTIKYILIILIISACERKMQHFDIKSREFNQRSSHHYSEKFEDSSNTFDELKSEIENNESAPETNTSQISHSDSNQVIDFSEEVNTSEETEKGVFSSFIDIFSSSDETIDSLDQVIVDCEERLYTSKDEVSSHQYAISSLINERNQLLKQLDSLQTLVVNSKRNSSNRVRDLERNQRKLKALIEILSKEIE